MDLVVSVLSGVYGLVDLIFLGFCLVVVYMRGFVGYEFGISLHRGGFSSFGLLFDYVPSWLLLGLSVLLFDGFGFSLGWRLLDLDQSGLFGFPVVSFGIRWTDNFLRVCDFV